MTGLLVGSALGGVAATAALAWWLGRLTRWRSPERWFAAAAVLVAAGIGVGLWLSRALPNDGCDDICDTPAWRGLLAGWMAAAAALPVLLLATAALIAGRREGSRGGP